MAATVEARAMAAAMTAVRAAVLEMMAVRVTVAATPRRGQ